MTGVEVEDLVDRVQNCRVGDILISNPYKDFAIFPLVHMYLRKTESKQ